MNVGDARGRARWSGILLGVGLGGFVDGIVLHQILQWHNMLSARVPPHSMAAMQTNMRADGWFHAAVWIATFAGVLMLWQSAQARVHLPNTRWFIGLLLMGWGGFNLVEGTINHHLLRLHHVRDVPSHVPLYDLLFLVIGGAGLLIVGWRLAAANRSS